MTDKQPKLRQIFTSTNRQDIDRFFERNPGPDVAAFWNDWGMGSGKLRVGRDVAALNRWDAEVLFAWATHPNHPIGPSPWLMEGFVATLTRRDVRSLAEFFTRLEKEMEDWDGKKPPEESGTS